VSDEAPDRSIKRIDDLLRKAQDFRRHGEDGPADAALALAEKIMIKYSIDATVLASRRTVAERDAIDVVYVPFTGIYRAALVTRFDVLAQRALVGGRSFIVREDKTSSLALVGRPDVVEPLRTLVVSLHLQVITSLNHWWKSLPSSRRSSGMPGFKARRQYVSSFINGATERIVRSRQLAVDEGEPGTELVLRSERDEVSAFLEANFKLSTSRTRLQPGTSDAARDGYAAGQLAQTGETPVGSNRRQLTT
jgi:NAD(P)H-dependent FMN reductase